MQSAQTEETWQQREVCNIAVGKTWSRGQVILFLITLRKLLFDSWGKVF